MGIYGQVKLPVLGTVAFKEIEDKAREAMKDQLRECCYPSQGCSISFERGC